MIPGPLLTLAEDLLRAGRIVLPATSTLERLAASVASHAVQDLFERIAAGLPQRLRDAIEDLVNVPDGEHRSPLAHLKEPPSAARASAVAARLARLDLVGGCSGLGWTSPRPRRNWCSTWPSSGAGTTPRRSGVSPRPSGTPLSPPSWSRPARACLIRS